MPVLAIPYIVPFAEAAGIAIGSIAGAVGLMELSKRVQSYMDANPEESLKILTLLAPAQGIAAMFNKKASEGEEEVIEEVEVEEKPKRKKSKKEIVLEGLRKARAGKGNYSDPDATGPAVSARGNIIRGLAEAGKIKDESDPNYDPSKKYKGYKRFLKAKGGVVRGLDAGIHKNVRLI
jgi:hypothetical protein